MRKLFNGERVLLVGLLIALTQGVGQLRSPRCKARLVRLLGSVVVCVSFAVLSISMSSPSSSSTAERLALILRMAGLFLVKRNFFLRMLDLGFLGILVVFFPPRFSQRSFNPSFLARERRLYSGIFAISIFYCHIGSNFIMFPMVSFVHGDCRDGRVFRDLIGLNL